MKNCIPNFWELNDNAKLYFQLLGTGMGMKNPFPIWYLVFPGMVGNGNSRSLLPSHRVCIYIGPKLILGVCDLQPDDGDFDVDNHNRMIMIMGVHIDNDDFESTF